MSFRRDDMSGRIMNQEQRIAKEKVSYRAVRDSVRVGPARLGGAVKRCHHWFRGVEREWCFRPLTPSNLVVQGANGRR